MAVSVLIPDALYRGPTGSVVDDPGLAVVDHEPPLSVGADKPACLPVDIVGCPLPLGPHDLCPGEVTPQSGVADESTVGRELACVLLERRRRPEGNFNFVLLAGVHHQGSICQGLILRCKPLGHQHPFQRS